jgi:pentatricopeptide repeat protein
VISYAAAMAACRDKPPVVLGLLERMYRSNVEPNTVVLTTAINSLAREGGEYTNEAYKMLQKMEKNGPEPNIYTYNTVTRAFAEDGRLDEAIKILTTIRARGLQPDRFTFTTLLMACGRTNSSDEVCIRLSVCVIICVKCIFLKTTTLSYECKRTDN